MTTAEVLKTPRPSAMPTYLKYGADDLKVAHERRPALPLEYDVVQRAVAALANPEVEAFTRAQVAFLIQLALDYRNADERQAGYDQANTELIAALTVALGGPEAESFGQARGWHERAVAQLRRRRESDARARLPHPGDYTGGPVEWDDEPVPQERGRPDLQVAA